MLGNGADLVTRARVGGFARALRRDHGRSHRALIPDDTPWIAKFTRADDRYNQPRVEHALLELAKAYGLTAADSRLTTMADRDVLLVRRFDRDRADTGYRRHRMVSAVTLLRTDDDPTTRTDWSYLLLADEIRRISASPEEDLRELFGRMVFNAAISNLDDHPRNHAILGKDGGWRLSPAYDLTPDPVIAQDSRPLALECGLEGRWASKGNLLSGCGRFLLGREDAEHIFGTVTETVRVEWLAGMRRAGVTEQDCERIARAFLYDGLFYDGG